MRYQLAKDVDGRPPSPPIEITWPELAAGLTRPGPRGMWRPGIGPGRTANTIEVVEALVLDYDRPVQLERIRLFWAPWGGCLHATKSATKDAPRWRVVIPLLAPVPGPLWFRVYRWALARDPLLDRSCSDASRCWWRPVRGEFWHAETWDGPPLVMDASKLPDPNAPVQRRRRLVLESDPERQKLERLRHDPAERAALGEALGGRVSRGIARDVPCPGCGRRSVWWALTRGGARCDHTNTCGWRGSLASLAGGDR